jgi:putative acetyltransferase
VGWYSWYAIRRALPERPAAVIGAGGFLGPPDERGEVEIGFSIVAGHRRQGYAREMVAALTARALEDPRTLRVIAHVQEENRASRGVLEGEGFRRAGAGPEPGSLRYELDRNGSMVRKYRPADRTEVISLFRRTVREINSRDYSPEQIAAWAQESSESPSWTERLATGGVFLSERGGRIAGFLRIDDAGLVDLIYVHPDFLGRGVGRELMARAVAWARERGLGRLESEVSISARPFFEHLGFRVLREQTVESRGVSFRNYRMERTLAD